MSLLFVLVSGISVFYTVYCVDGCIVFSRISVYQQESVEEYLSGAYDLLTGLRVDEYSSPPVSSISTDAADALQGGQCLDEMFQVEGAINGLSMMESDQAEMLQYLSGGGESFAGGTGNSRKGMCVRCCYWCD